MQYGRQDKTKDFICMDNNNWWCEKNAPKMTEKWSLLKIPRLLQCRLPVTSKIWRETNSALLLSWGRSRCKGSLFRRQQILLKRRLIPLIQINADDYQLFLDFLPVHLQTMGLNGWHTTFVGHGSQRSCTMGFSWQHCDSNTILHTVDIGSSPHLNQSWSKLTNVMKNWFHHWLLSQ